MVAGIGFFAAGSVRTALPSSLPRRMGQRAALMMGKSFVLSLKALLTVCTEKLYVYAEREIHMAAETTYTALREKLASYLNRVTDDREVLIVRRRGARDVAIVPADELAGLMETAHLLRSPKNAERLTESLRELERGDGEVVTLEEVRRSVGLEKAS